MNIRLTPARPSQKVHRSNKDKSRFSSPKPPSKNLNLLSGIECIREGVESNMMLALVVKAQFEFPPNCVVPPDLSTLLDEFKDVTPTDLPSELPPMRDIQHTIDLSRVYLLLHKWDTAVVGFDRMKEAYPTCSDFSSIFQEIAYVKENKKLLPLTSMAKMKSDAPVDYAAFQFQLSPKYSREACRKFKSLNESSHGKNYDRYMQRRDAKLREEWSAYREEMKQMRDAKLMEEWSACREEMKALKFSGANKATRSQVKSYARSRSSNDALNQIETGAARMKKNLGAAEKGMTRGVKGLFKFGKKKPEGDENTSISIGRFSRLLSIR